MPVLQEKWITSPQSVIKDLFGERIINFVCFILLHFIAKRGENVAESASWGIREFFEEKLKFEKDLSSVSVEAVSVEAVSVEALCIYNMVCATHLGSLPEL